MAFRTENHDDLQLFRNRLWFLMSKSGYDAAKKLAAALIKRGLVSVRHADYTPGDAWDPLQEQKDIEATRKKVERHLNADTADALQGEFARAYCQLFGCSADLLFGFITTPTHAQTDIAAETGLSTATVKTILDSHKDETSKGHAAHVTHLLNILLGSKRGSKKEQQVMQLFSNIHAYITSGNISAYIARVDHGMLLPAADDCITFLDESGHFSSARLPISNAPAAFLVSINEGLRELKRWYDSQPGAHVPQDIHALLSQRETYTRAIKFRLDSIPDDCKTDIDGNVMPPEKFIDSLGAVAVSRGYIGLIDEIILKQFPEAVRNGNGDFSAQEKRQLQEIRNKKSDDNAAFLK